MEKTASSAMSSFGKALHLADNLNRRQIQNIFVTDFVYLRGNVMALRETSCTV